MQYLNSAIWTFQISNHDHNSNWHLSVIYFLLSVLSFGQILLLVWSKLSLQLICLIPVRVKPSFPTSILYSVYLVIIKNHQDREVTMLLWLLILQIMLGMTAVISETEGIY